MTFTPQHVYDTYRKDQNHDMWPYSEFLRMNARGNILEIGVRDGVSTAAFLLGLEKNGGHLFSVDIDPECQKLFDHPQWTFRYMDSRNILLAAEFTSKAWNFDIALVDGNHAREFVHADLRACGKLVRPGGLILVHDIFGTPGGATEKQAADNWPTRAVGEEFREYTNEMGWPTFDLPGRFGMGVIVRL